MIHDCKQERRLSQLEVDAKVNTTSINNLVTQLKELTSEVKWLIRISIGCLLGICGFFLQQVFEKGGI